MKLYCLDKEYVEYLRKNDSRVPSLNDREHKERRPFIVTKIQINSMNYYLPLTSPKEKHKTMRNQIDFQKIDNGELGAINFNNMIPAHNEFAMLLNLESLENGTCDDKKYAELLRHQLQWIGDNQKEIENKALNLYTLRIENKLKPNVEKRCVDFKFIEKCAIEYHNAFIKHKIEEQVEIHVDTKNNISKESNPIKINFVKNNSKDNGIER